MLIYTARTDVFWRLAPSASHLSVRWYVRVQEAVARASRQKLAEESGAQDSSSHLEDMSSAAEKKLALAHDGAGHRHDDDGREVAAGGGCQIVERIWPHLSMEDPPSVVGGWQRLWSDTCLEIIRCRVNLV